jgi:hypothetical protein
MATGMGYKANCGFIDKSTFYVKLKQNFAWPKNEIVQ